MKKIFYYIIILTALTSCTKVIDLQLGNDSGKLDIEANVVNTAGPQTIKLSTNVPFTNTNVYPAVSGATVTVKDQLGNSYLFTEAPAGTYTNSKLTGKPGNTYIMTVLNKGTTYTATSTMPAVIALDSVTSKNSPVSSGSNPRKVITVHYQDPAGVANQQRFVMFVNSVQVKVVIARNDQFNDGRYVNLDLRENDIDIYAGDTVTVEMQCVDEPMYLYWFTLAQQSANGPGGSVTPSDPPSNISPVSLGYFSAHTTQTQTILVK